MADSTNPARSALQIRTLLFDLEARSAADGEGIPVVVSSDSVVDVRDGPEILVHTPDAIDLTRAPLPIVATHTSGQVNVGIVDNLRIAGGKLRGLATFGARPEADGYKRDVLNRIIRSVSVGYARMHATVRADGVLVTDRWMPYHAAMIAEPADPSAGFFRESGSVPQFEMVEESKPADLIVRTADAAGAANKGAAMAEDTNGAAVGAAQPTQAPDAQTLERLRTTGIMNLARQNYGSNVKITDDQRQAWINDGKSCDDVAREILGLVQEATKNQKPATTLDMTPKEVRNYSLWKALRAVVDNNWKGAEFEAEASRAVAQKLGRTPENNSLLIPYEVQTRPVDSSQRGTFLANGRRDLSVAAGGGGYLVETSNVGFIEMLRNRSVAFAMGVERLTGLVGNVNIPKQSAAATGYWLAAETTQITESAQTFVQIPLTPRTVGAYTEISRLLLLQSSPGAEGIVTSDLAAVVGLAADLGVIAGTGTAQPQGIIGTSGLGALTSGTSFDYADILEFQSKVATANIRPNRGGYVTTPTIAALAMARSRFANTDTPLWNGNVWDATMAGFPAMSSMQVPTGDMLFGDWSTVVVGEWGVLEIAVNPTANFQAGIIGIRAMYTMDVGVRHPAAFTLGTSMT